MALYAIPSAGYPYVDRLYAAVRALGVEVEEGAFTGRWMWASLRSGDALHFHWPSFFYDGPGSPPRVVGRFARFAMLLVFARAMGCRLFWTAHNLMPHERVTPRFLDVAARHLCIALCERVFVHGASAGRVLAGRFPPVRHKMEVTHHGHLVGFYPQGVTRTDARVRLEVSESAFVYLFFGACKPYKGLEKLIHAFKGVTGDCVLLIAGRFTDATYQRTIEALAKSDPRVRVDARFVPDDEVQNYLVASDVVVVPYRDILTSATVVLAFAFGRPAVSVRLGCLPDVVPPAAGLLYEPDAPNGLEHALEQVRRLRFSEASIIAHALRFDWEAPARALVEAYKGGASRDA